MAKFSKCTLRNKQFLELISKLSKNKKFNSKLKQIVLSATPDEINSVTEVAANTLKGNICYNNRSRSKLKQFQQEIRSIAKPKLSVKQRKNIIIQRGGFLSTLLAPILAAVASELITKYV